MPIGNDTRRQIDLPPRHPTRKVIGIVDTPAELERALERHGGHFVDYYAPLAIQQLVP